MKRNPADPVSLRLFDPERGDLPLQLSPLGAETLREPQRSNCFTVVWVRKGDGVFHPDLASHPFAWPTLLFANPYQTLFLDTDSGLDGIVLRFHANFLCIETHHEEIGCNGVLFNDHYGEPQVRVGKETAVEIETLLGQMEREFQAGGLAHSELLVSLMKILLIKASRLKLDAMETRILSPVIDRPEVLARLAALIEENHRTLHRPADYAPLLAMTPKALGKLVKKHFGKTLTEMIRERVLKHAKWQLLHTLRPVKEIAAEAGFADELYFSRLFKRTTGFSPSGFREFETAIRGGRNLSM